MNKLRIKVGVLAMVLVLALGGCGSGGSIGNVATSETVGGGGASSTGSSTSSVSLDATACNPGESINPIDKGKSFQSTNFKYTLLDVRQDSLEVDPVLKGSVNYNKVLLVKLEVENISQDDDLNLSIAEIDLVRNNPPVDTRSGNDKYSVDLLYPHEKTCVNLATDVGVGSFPKGKKVVGYYVFGLPDEKGYDKGLYFDARYFAAEDVGTEKSLKVAGYVKIK